MKTAQERLAAMEADLRSAKGDAHVAVHVIATSRGWVVYLAGERLDYFPALDQALAAAEARTRAIVHGDALLAQTLGIAS